MSILLRFEAFLGQQKGAHLELVPGARDYLVRSDLLTYSSNTPRLDLARYLPDAKVGRRVCGPLGGLFDQLAG
jgi:hypothetical protein